MSRLAVEMLLPPLGLLWLLAAGMAWGFAGSRTGRALAAAAFVLLVAAALPAVGTGLLRTVERTGDAPAAPARTPQAIIVLSAEAYAGASAVEGVVGPLSLERLRTTAALARRTGLPILVSGGDIGTGTMTLAGILADSLERDFGVPVAWREDRSRTSCENVIESVRILRQAGIESAYVVTHAWHLPRVLPLYAEAGFTAVGYPVAEGRPRLTLMSFLPQARAWRDTYFAFHELVGRLAYGAGACRVTS